MTATSALATQSDASTKTGAEMPLAALILTASLNWTIGVVSAASASEQRGSWVLENAVYRGNDSWMTSLALMEGAAWNGSLIASCRAWPFVTCANSRETRNTGQTAAAAQTTRA